MIHIFKKSIPVLAIVLLSFSSCNKWLELKPQEGVVAEDYWKTKEQVRAAVNGLYISLITPIYGNRHLSQELFMHAEIRTDMVDISTFAPQTYTEYRFADMLPTNLFSDWGMFYKIINYCNNVIDNAPAVRELDPTFTQADLDAYVGEALAIRAWMYLNLARIWGDVPIKLTYTASDEDLVSIAKSPQATVLQAVVDDLLRAEPMVRETFGSTAADKGKITRYTVNAMLADAYLWQNDFQKAADACDEIINAGIFELVPGDPSTWLNQLFGQGNSVEGIFELQYDRQQLNPFYALFRQNALYTAGQHVYEDLFQFDAMDPENFDVRGDRGALSTATNMIYKYHGLNRTQTKSLEESYTHWMVYRYADVLLMKAEALNGLNRGQEALDLLYTIRERGNAMQGTDLDPAPDDQQGITTFIVEERAREFAYEGKRWFDVLRNARRNNYQRIDLITNMVVNYAPADRQQAMLGKYRDVNSHYLPIYFIEIQRSGGVLQQNPFYGN
ncbi:putative outer membrane starch-binding protein [Sphingobacterium allocomposti]|uniref:Putative outer membrane starch-binding protein n=1 Tax=Sphingobacterium allocomposti TaxID=415956 RepID=A0A5S5DQZ6_9SPHI|nr:RagB/SusD family nutrient uptake outer membrane protein [Sphingobacterium composti Yoo et al. 2007 non Ten et al. 2007]TYP98380.1 putative outer membrane starch-binding protein [Sphingobacterium composti Yoo et al. 2007 non Ten et al. 2007]